MSTFKTNKNLNNFPIPVKINKIYIGLFQLNSYSNIKFYKLVNLKDIKNIQLLKLNTGFDKLYSGINQFLYGYFGYYNKNKYLLGNIIQPQIVNKNYFKNSSLKKTLFITIRGRLNGVNKARKFRVGNIKTNSISMPLDYSENPIQTKWGKLGLKIYRIERF